MIGKEPWLPYEAARFLLYAIQQRLGEWPWVKVFEWGSGASTAFFKSLGDCRVVSVEHDPEWYRQVSPCINPKLDRLLLREPTPGCVAPDKANPLAYYSEVLGDVSLENYAKAIDDFDQFDVVLIDGRARPSCLYHAVPRHVLLGGYVVLDNTDSRPYYLEQTAHLFEGWDRITFYGRGPKLDYPWETTIWRRPEDG
jgi:hypothetical protein